MLADKWEQICPKWSDVTMRMCTLPEPEQFGINLLLSQRLDPCGRSSTRAKNPDSVNAVIFVGHNKYTPALTAQVQVGPDPACAIADGNLLKIKQGREILNMF